MRIVAFVSAGGFALAGISNVLEHCADADALGLTYVTGLVLGILTLLATGIGLIRGGRVPRAAAWILAVATVCLLAFGEQGGMAVFGVGWILFGALCYRTLRPSAGSSAPA